MGLAALTLSLGCASVQRASSDMPLHARSLWCASPDWTTQSSVATPTQIDPREVARLHALGLSQKASWAAVGLGLATPILERAERFENPQTMSVSRRFEAIELDHLIDRRVSIIGLDVSALAAVLECYQGRWEDQASVFEHETATRDVALTVAALVTGAVSGLGAGALELAGEDTAATITGIAGGTTGAILGAALFFPGPRLAVNHGRSLMADLWFGRATSNYAPRAVWLFLNATPPDGESLREILLRRVRELGEFGAEGSPEYHQREALFFGQSEMSADDLRAYAAMLDELESQVMGIHTMLNRLLRELDAWRDARSDAVSARLGHSNCPSPPRTVSTLVRTGPGNAAGRPRDEARQELQRRALQRSNRSG